MRIAWYQRWHNTECFIDNLQGIIEGYNKSKHRTIKTRLVDVTRETEDRVFFDSYVPKQPKAAKRYHFKVGDNVQIAADRHVFLREHFQRWSEELFKVTKRWRSHNINMYK